MVNLWQAIREGGVGLGGWLLCRLGRHDLSHVRPSDTKHVRYTCFRCFTDVESEMVIWELPEPVKTPKDLAAVETK